jgi:hypothetical protein
MPKSRVSAFPRFRQVPGFSTLNRPKQCVVTVSTCVSGLLRWQRPTSWCLNLTATDVTLEARKM